MALKPAVSSAMSNILLVLGRDTQMRFKPAVSSAIVHFLTCLKNVGYDTGFFSIFLNEFTNPPAPRISFLCMNVFVVVGSIEIAAAWVAPRVISRRLMARSMSDS